MNTEVGAVEVRDITARIDVHSGTGSIDVQGVEGIPRLGIGAGDSEF